VTPQERNILSFCPVHCIAIGDLDEIEGVKPKGIRLPVAIYAKTSGSKMPTAHKLSAYSGGVERSLAYRRDDESAAIVILQKENLIKAYRYGRTLVPFTKIDEAAMEYRTEKTLSLLGFVPNSSINHAAFLSTVWVVEATDSPANMTALTALVQACWERGVVGLARYVRAAGNSQRLVALMPRMDPDCPAAFLMVALPFAEDLRRFTFPSLDALPAALQPTQAQKDKMKAWIGAVSLSQEQALNPESTPNPANQRLVQAILSRIQDPAGPVPPVEPRILQPFLGPPTSLVKSAVEQFEAIRSAFELRAAPTWQHAEITRFWGVESAEVESTTAAAEPVREKSVDDKEPAEPLRTISAERPVEDFEAMVTDRHHDLVLPAFRQLMALIPHLTLNHATRPLAIDSLMALRLAAIREDEQDLFNAYIQELKRAAVLHFEEQREEKIFDDEIASDSVSPAAMLWEELRQHPNLQVVTLISSAEHPASLVTPLHAETFFTDF